MEYFSIQSLKINLETNTILNFCYFKNIVKLNNYIGIATKISRFTFFFHSIQFVWSAFQYRKYSLKTIKPLYEYFSILHSTTALYESKID